MAATMGPITRTDERVDFRSAAKHLRQNAGIAATHEVTNISAIADVGAAARRLRASNIWAEPVSHATAAVDDEPIVFEVPSADVIYLDVSARDRSAEADRNRRRGQLAGRASQLLASAEAQMGASAKRAHPAGRSSLFGRPLHAVR